MLWINIFKVWPPKKKFDFQNSDGHNWIPKGKNNISIGIVKSIDMFEYSVCLSTSIWVC